MSDPLGPPGPWVVARSLVFTVWLYGLIFVLGSLALPLLIGPRAWVMWLVRIWVDLVMWGLKVFVGQTVEFRGLQYRPTGAAVVAAKHLSMLDTITPFMVLPDPCFVLKRELVKLPIYGWFVNATDMIPVDRSGGSSAVRALSAAAMARLKRNRQIVIFPEGTRKPLGAPPQYKSGVAALYRDMDMACIPMATNSGVFWPAHGFIRRPGLVVFEFLPPIPAGLTRAQFMRRLETAVETGSDALLAEAGLIVPKHPTVRKRGEAATEGD